MPRPARPGFRVYVEAMRDPKMRRLAPAQRWLWVAVLSAARESSRPGWLLVSPDEPFTVADLADYAGMKPKEVAQGTAEMCRLGMLDIEYPEEAWFVPAWNDRQYESDSSAERVRKHRSMEQGCNAETPLLVTPPETETETDTPKGVSHTRKKPKKSCPTPFEVPPEDIEWVQAHYPRVDWDHETKKLVNWAKAKDAQYVDWSRFWRGWMQRASEGWQ
jgi:hypothetical protein